MKALDWWCALTPQETQSLMWVREAHLRHLYDNVFHVATRWPHYRLLLNDMRNLSTRFEGKRVLSLERSISETCGSPTAESRWAPLFERLTVVNHGLYSNERTYEGAIGEYDLVIVPNLLHHVRDAKGLLGYLGRLSSLGAVVYIFDTPFRETHDAPGHFYMFTPYGIRAALEDAGFTDINLQEVASSWEAVHYCLDFIGRQDGPLISEEERARILAKASEDMPYDADGRRMTMAWSVVAI